MARRQYYQRIFQKGQLVNFQPFWRAFKRVIFGFLILFLLSLLLFIYYAKDLPRPEKFTERALTQSTKIYDRSGQVLLYEIYGEEKRTWAPLSVIPEHVKQAVIASEDANFYRHFGVDLKGVIRAVLSDLKIGKATYGGSTLPQQLIRSTYLSPKKTAERKTREIILALELDRRYSKDQILEWYLNQVPFGQNAYGVEAASQTYFKKSVSEISLQEAAVLTALIQAPSYLSPYGDHKPELLGKKDRVLDRMTQLGYINKEQAEQAKKTEISFAKILRPIKAPHFIMYVRDYLIEKYGEDFLKEKGARVYTSLDWDLQEWAEKKVLEGAEFNGKNYYAFNSALVALDSKTGEILAMVGSKDWFGEPFPKNCLPGKNCLFEPQPNVVLRPRQPGSAFKPFVYAEAFKKGADDKTVVIDEQTNFGGWGGQDYIPQNYDGKFRGPVTLRQALAQSLNVPSVKVLRDLAGLEDSVELAKNMGVTTLDKPSSFYGLSLVLGGGEVKLLDMVSAYNVFATDGLRIPPSAVLKVEDSEGNILEENKKTPKRVLEKEITDLINSVLSDNEARAPIFGLHSSMYIPDYQVAAKTGTTQDYKDGWIVGYSPSVVAGVWTGNNDNSPMKHQPGAVVAGRIWKQFMEKALLKYPKENF